MPKRKNNSDSDPADEIAEIAPDLESGDETDRFEDAAEPEAYGVADDELAPYRDMSDRGLEARTSERKTVRVQTVVQFKESEEDAWKEMIEVTTVSRNGAALILSRPCPVGRIVSLVMQMPPDLRLYDHYAAVYPMLAIVQNCTKTLVNDKPFYHVGVAFIGKKVPHAYKSNPKQCFRIKGVTKDGLWEPVPCAKEFRSRKHSRFWRSLEVTVTVRDEARRTSQKRNVLTRDVSAGGMAVWGPLDVEIGDRVKITSKNPEFYSMGTVRNRSENEQDRRRTLIHFEFDGGRFPIEKLPMPGQPGEPEAREEKVIENVSSEESTVIE